MKRILAVIVWVLVVVPVCAAGSAISNLEDLSLAAGSYWNGSGLEGSYEGVDTLSSGAAALNNYYAYDADFMYESWRWFAYSNMTDTQSSGFGAQYNAIPGKGQDGSDIYVIGYCDQYAAGNPEVTFSSPQTVSGVYVTNTNYAYYSMLNGDEFAKKFEDGDWFTLTITGKDENGTETGSVDFKLADGTDIVDSWEWVDLKDLSEVKTLVFSLTSSDTGMFGMNTPAYFAMDSLDGAIDFENLTLEIESFWNGSGLEGAYTATDRFTSGIATYNNYFSYDKDFDYFSWSGFSYSNLRNTAAEALDGQYTAIAGRGAKGSRTYALGYCNTFASVQPEITLDEERIISGVYVTNTAYAYYSMSKGDQFAKKFESGDWFKLTITGKDASGAQTGTVAFLLADGEDIVKTWEWVDLTLLGPVKKLEFSLSSSDSDPGLGMNTPAYFALDSLNDPDEDDNSDNRFMGCFINSLQ